MFWGGGCLCPGVAGGKDEKVKKDCDSSKEPTKKPIFVEIIEQAV